MGIGSKSDIHLKSGAILRGKEVERRTRLTAKFGKYSSRLYCMISETIEFEYDTSILNWT